MAEEGKLDPVVGREIERVSQIWAVVKKQPC
jgi:hypothetical protein